MNPKAAQNYLRAKVLTATPEQLQLMLFDGAIRFCEQGRVALDQKNFAQSHSVLIKAQKIVNQLQCGLNREVSPDLCDKLKGIYVYAHKKLVEATIHHRIESLDEALNLLKYQRETWVMLLDQLTQQKAAAAAANMNVPPPDPRMEASISMQG